MKRMMSLERCRTAELISLFMTLNEKPIWGHDPLTLQLLGCTGKAAPDACYQNTSIKYHDMYPHADWSLIEPAMGYADPFHYDPIPLEKAFSAKVRYRLVEKLKPLPYTFPIQTLMIAGCQCGAMEK